MADATYDAVIIGAGHNGLALAAYLAKSGWDVAVFEVRGEEGGGLATEEVTRPGFLHNLHANYHTLVGVCPVYDDLNLYDHGVRYERPPVQMGAVFQDGTALTIHTDLDKTCASIARFSQKDADTFRRLYEEAKGYMDMLIRTLMYSPPIPLADITKALVVWKVEEKSEFLSVHLRQMSVNDFLEKHFENEKVKAMLAFHSAVGGYSTDRKGLAVSYPLLVGKIDNWHVSVGGSHNLAHALWEAVAHSGGRVFLKHGVEEIIIENGRAVGVELAHEGRVLRGKAVMSTLDPHSTFLDLVGREHLPADMVTETEGWAWDKWSFNTLHIAADEPPRYACDDPWIDEAFATVIGIESVDQLLGQRHLILGAPHQDGVLFVVGERPPDIGKRADRRCDLLELLDLGYVFQIEDLDHHFLVVTPLGDVIVGHEDRVLGKRLPKGLRQDGEIP